MANSDWAGNDTGNEGKFNTAANWAGGVPATGDAARFPAGSYAVTGDFDQSAKNFAEFYTALDFSGDIAEATSYLLLGATRVTHRGSGSLYLDNTSSTYDFDDVLLKSDAATGRLFLKGSVGECQAHAGRMTYQSGTMTKLWAENMGAPLDVTVTAATVQAAYVLGGIFMLDSASGLLTTLDVLSGTVTIKSGTVSLLRIWGGTVDWRSTITCPQAVCYGGTLNCTRDGRAKTFTDLETHHGCRVDMQNGPNNITVTNPIHYIGGDVKAPNATFAPTV